MKKRAIIYTRVSTGEQFTENQERDLIDYAERAGLEVVEIISETAVSGTTSFQSREGGKRVMERAHRKEFDILLFWSLDRLSRNGIEQTLGILRELTEAGIVWHSYSEPHFCSDNEAVAKLMIAMMATFAQMERDRLIERTKAGLERAKAQGKTLGRPVGATSRTKKVDDMLRNIKRWEAEGMKGVEMARLLGVSRGRICQLKKML